VYPIDAATATAWLRSGIIEAEAEVEAAAPVPKVASRKRTPKEE
jgi:hypothetical protein